MKYGYSLLLGSLLGVLSISYADNNMNTSMSNNNTETAASVISVKMPVIDAQALNNNSTEVFMELSNNGTESHELIAATCPIADQVQLHATINHGGKAMMEQIQGITLRTRHEKDLHLGGLHIMLLGLKKTLVENHSIPITLIFNDGSWTIVKARVS